MSDASADFRVDFLVAGAQKAGTTALAHFLAQHPGVCLAPEKEVHHFDGPDLDGLDFGGPRARAAYRARFPADVGGRLVGEATPIYMYLPQVPARIAAHHPGVKLLILLREPAARAVSHYLHERRIGGEWLPFAAAILRERSRLRRDRDPIAWTSAARHHSYVDRGRYADQIRRVLRHFPREQLLFLRSDDLRLRHAETLGRVFRFLGLAPPPHLPAAEEVHAATGRCYAPAALRRLIARRCLDSTRALGDLTGLDVDDWIRVAGA